MTSVALLSAGTDQAAICSPVVYLESTVIGDLTGHTTEWVQMTGTPTVELFQVTPTQSYYIVSGVPGSDKVFRFYIDRGSAFEQYREVTIRTTPASVTAYSENGGALGNTTDHPYAFVQGFRSVVLASFDETIQFNSVAAYVTDSGVLAYALPELYYQTLDSNTQLFADRFVNTVVDMWNGSSWVNALTATYAQPREILLNTGDRIRIGATYRTPNGNKTDYSQWYDFSADVVSANTVINHIENGGTEGSVVLVKTIFQLVLQDYNENITHLENGGTTSSPTIVRIVYELVPLVYDENITMVENGGATGKYTITRVSGGSIGG